MESKQQLIEEVSLARIWKLAEIAEPNQLQSLKLKAPMKVEKVTNYLRAPKKFTDPIIRHSVLLDSFCLVILRISMDSYFSHFIVIDSRKKKLTLFLVTKISRLLFTNSGNSLLALTSNGVHLLWNWPRCAENTTGKVRNPKLLNTSTNNIQRKRKIKFDIDTI